MRYAAFCILFLASGLDMCAKEPSGTTTTEKGYLVFTPERPRIFCLARVSERNWEVIYNAKNNPFLRKPGRRFVRNGIIHVTVHWGELIEVPAGVHLEDGVEVEYAAPPPTPLPTSVAPPATKSKEVSIWRDIWPVIVFWFVVALLALLVISAVDLYRRRQREIEYDARLDREAALAEAAEQEYVADVVRLTAVVRTRVTQVAICDPYDGAATVVTIRFTSVHVTRRTIHVDGGNLFAHWLS